MKSPGSVTTEAIEPSTAWDRFWFRPGSSAAAIIVRAVVFGVGAVVLVRDSEEQLTGSVVGAGDLWRPVGMYEWLPAPSAGLLGTGVVLAVLLGVVTGLGLGGRVVGLPAGLLLAYLVGVTNNLGKVNHDRNVLVAALIVLAFARPAGWSDREAWQWRWPVAAVQLSFGLMLFFAAMSKLRNSGLEWAFSENMRNILISENLVLRNTTLPDVALWIAEEPWRWRGAAVATILTEALVVFGIVSRRPLLRAAGAFAAFGLLAGLNLLLALGGWPLLILTLTLVDWDDVIAQTRPVAVTIVVAAGAALTLVVAFHRPQVASAAPIVLTVVLTLLALVVVARETDPRRRPLGTAVAEPLAAVPVPGSPTYHGGRRVWRWRLVDIADPCDTFIPCARSSIG